MSRFDCKFTTELPCCDCDRRPELAVAAVDDKGEGMLIPPLEKLVVALFPPFVLFAVEIGVCARKLLCKDEVTYVRVLVAWRA